MDDRATHARNAARLRKLVSELEVDGGDAVTVLLGMAERLVLGVDRYGPLDLDAPHDWRAEEDEERADIVNYQAIRRVVARRGTPTRSAARHADAVPDPIEDEDTADKRVVDVGHEETARSEVADPLLDPAWDGEPLQRARERAGKIYGR